MDGRSGTYRASVEFNGQRWYSPAAVVEGKDYSTSQKLEVTSDSRSMEVDKDNSAIFTYAPVRNSGDWGDRWYPYVIVYKDNVPKAFYDAMYAWSYNEILPDGGILVRPATARTPRNASSSHPPPSRSTRKPWYPAAIPSSPV